MTLVAEVARRFIIADIIGHPLSCFDLKPNIPVLTIKGGADDTKSQIYQGFDGFCLHHFFHLVKETTSTLPIQHGAAFIQAQTPKIMSTG